MARLLVPRSRLVEDSMSLQVRGEHFTCISVCIQSVGKAYKHLCQAVTE